MIYIDPLFAWMVSEELECNVGDIAATMYGFAKQCIACPPNITRKLNMPLDFNCWVLRGFYPNTNVMFKLTTTQDKAGGQVFSKVTLPSPRKGNKMHIFNQHEVDIAMQNVLLGVDNVKIEQHTPRLMTPKGMKPLRRSKHVK